MPFRSRLAVTSATRPHSGGLAEESRGENPSWRKMLDKPAWQDTYMHVTLLMVLLVSKRLEWRLLLTGTAGAFGAGGAAWWCAGKGFLSAGCTKDRKLLLYLLRVAFRTRDFLISEDKFLKVFSTTAALIFKNRHLLLLYQITSKIYFVKFPLTPFPKRGIKDFPLLKGTEGVLKFTIFSVLFPSPSKTSQSLYP